jgi:hypothetical protein
MLLPSSRQPLTKENTRREDCTRQKDLEKIKAVYLIIKTSQRVLEVKDAESNTRQIAWGIQGFGLFDQLTSSSAYACVVSRYAFLANKTPRIISGWREETSGIVTDVTKPPVFDNLVVSGGREGHHD